MAQITRQYDDAKLWNRLQALGLNIDTATVASVDVSVGAECRTSNVSVMFVWRDIPDAQVDEALHDSLRE